MKQDKVSLYVDWLLESPEFKKEIIKIRKRLGIPIEGLKKIYKWDERKKSDVLQMSDELSNKVMPEVLKILENHGLDPLWTIGVRAHLCWNDPITKLHTQHLVYITDLDDINNRDLLLYKSTPVCLMISAYASQRDIISFIQGTYSRYIKPIQDQYRKKGTMLGQIKNKKEFVKERNNFIYKHKNLPRKEIVTRLYDKYGPKIDIDVGYVGKIISVEKKRRKEV